MRGILEGREQNERNFVRKINKVKGMLGGRETKGKEFWEEEKQRERNFERKRNKEKGILRGREIKRNEF